MYDIVLHKIMNSFISFLQVVDMALALEAVSLLERTAVTKEALEVRAVSSRLLIQVKQKLNIYFCLTDHQTWAPCE